MMSSTPTPYGAPEPFRQVFNVLVLVPCLAAGIACAGKKEPEPLPSQTSTQVSPQLEPPPQLPPPVRQVRPTRPSTVKVIDPGGDEQREPETLFEASQRAQATKRTGSSPQPVAEINDENLHEYARDAEVILLEGAPAAPPLTAAIEAPQADAPVADPPGTRDEQYWRNAALKIRMNWRRTVDRIEELELESAALRQQFYAEEDTYIRDNHIKPDWDRVLDRLQQLRERSDRYGDELELFLEEGRQAGALPGWLSEGWELEPEGSELGDGDAQSYSAHQAQEPQVLQEVIDP